MKAEELAVIKGRAEKATEGPWYVDNYDGSVRGDDNKFICSQNFEDSDAEFIANAREDVPKLVAEVERLRSVIWRISEYCDMSIEETQVFLNEVDDE